MTDLARHIQETALCDTHEHFAKEADYLELKPDIIVQLFQNYVQHDFLSSGKVTLEQLDHFVGSDSPDIAGRFSPVEEAWKAIQHAGYAEATRLAAKHLYGIDEITGESLAAAAERNAEFVQPGQRLRVMRDIANLDHMQTDDAIWPCPPDEAGPDFLFYDLTWWAFCCGAVDIAALKAETGIEASDLASLRDAMEAVFAKHAPTAIAVKAQHAYNRTLQWTERTDAEAEKAFHNIRRLGEKADAADRLCLGDWAWARQQAPHLRRRYPLPRRRTRLRPAGALLVHPRPPGRSRRRTDDRSTGPRTRHPADAGEPVRLLPGGSEAGSDCGGVGGTTHQECLTGHTPQYTRGLPPRLHPVRWWQRSAKHYDTEPVMVYANA